jgi:uncharacterized membrane protein HdeD (DUF308 family)
LSFGLSATLFWPLIESVNLLIALFFGMLFCSDGIFASAISLILRSLKYWWILFAQGVVNIIFAIIFLQKFDMAKEMLPIIIIFWSIVTGVLVLIAGTLFGRKFKGVWRINLSGILAIILGLAITFRLVTDTRSIMWLVSGYLVIYGVLQLIIGLKRFDPSA